jgi:hypothetical protein
MMPFLDIPSFIFSLAGRFSAPVAIFTSLLLFLPDSAMDYMQLLEIGIFQASCRLNAT